VLTENISLYSGDTYSHVSTECVLCRTKTSFYENLKMKLREIEPIDPKIILLEIDNYITVMIIDYKYDIISNDHNNYYMEEIFDDLEFNEHSIYQNIDYFKNGYICLDSIQYEKLDEFIDSMYDFKKSSNEITYVFPQKYVNSTFNSILEKLKQ